MKIRIVIWVQNGCKYIRGVVAWLAGWELWLLPLPRITGNIIPYVAGLRKSQNLKEGFYLTNCCFSTIINLKTCKMNP